MERNFVTLSLAAANVRCMALHSYLLTTGSPSAFSMSEPIENWAAIVHKGVRTKDRLELGNVVEVDSEKFIAIQGVVKEKEYSLPHSVVESFDGAEVRLNITHKEAENYLVK